MKSLMLLTHSAIKFTKGLFVIYSILIATTFIAQSCKKTETFTKDDAAKKLLTAINEHRESIGKVSVKPVNKAQSSTQRSGSITESIEDEQIAYLTFENMPIDPDYTYDISGMANLVNDYNGVVSYVPADNSFEFVIPVEEVNNSILPLIPDARAYLNARGLTNADIDLMIQEEGAQEIDLVPFAATLAEYESSGATGMNYSNLFINSAYARADPLHCAAVALGVDALWALGGSNASAWTAAGMKTAFKAVAKRALGPIGVAIAVVSFGLCMADAL